MTVNRIALFRTLRNYSWDQEDWFLPLKAALEGVGPAEAAWQPPGGGNTIWQTVEHINYYNERQLCRLTGVEFGPEQPTNLATFGGAHSASNTAGWQAELERTHRIAEGLQKALAELTEEDLDKPFITGTLADRLASWIMHDTYHTGQIALLRKQQGTWPAQRG